MFWKREPGEEMEREEPLLRIRTSCHLLSGGDGVLFSHTYMSSVFARFSRLGFFVLCGFFLSGCALEYPQGQSMEVMVQDVLAKQGYYRGPVDGSIGPSTSRAIRSYQYDHRLAQTGTINQALIVSMGLVGEEPVASGSSSSFFGINLAGLFASSDCEDGGYYNNGGCYNGGYYGNGGYYRNGYYCNNGYGGYGNNYYRGYGNNGYRNGYYGHGGNQWNNGNNWNNGNHNNHNNNNHKDHDGDDHHKDHDDHKHHDKDDHKKHHKKHDKDD